MNVGEQYWAQCAVMGELEMHSWKCSWMIVGKQNEFCLTEALEGVSFCKCKCFRLETAMRIYKIFYYFTTFLRVFKDLTE